MGVVLVFLRVVVTSRTILGSRSTFETVIDHGLAEWSLVFLVPISRCLLVDHRLGSDQRLSSDIGREQFTLALFKLNHWSDFSLGSVIKNVDLLSSLSERVLKVDEFRTRVQLSADVVSRELTDEWRLNVE